jgi:hypothetical protein
MLSQNCSAKKCSVLREGGWDPRGGGGDERGMGGRGERMGGGGKGEEEGEPEERVVGTIWGDKGSL